MKSPARYEPHLDSYIDTILYRLSPIDLYSSVLNLDAMVLSLFYMIDEFELKYN